MGTQSGLQRFFLLYLPPTTSPLLAWLPLPLAPLASLDTPQTLFPLQNTDSKAYKSAVVGKGLTASPGAAIGRVVFNADDAEEWHKQVGGGSLPPPLPRQPPRLPSFQVPSPPHPSSPPLLSH